MAGLSVRFASVVDRGVAVALIGAVALVACGGQQRDDGRGEGASPPVSVPERPDSGSGAGAGGLVLRWRMTGGIAGLGGPGTLPEFSLYGDGRAIARPRTGDEGPVPARQEHRLRPDALHRLLDEARAAGLERSRTFGAGRIADAMVLEIRMGTARTRIEQPESRPELPVVRFWKRLDPAGWSPADLAAPSRPYVATRVAVLAAESPGTAGQGVSDWPLDRPLGRGERAAGGLCAVLTGDDRDTAVRHVATAGAGHRWRSGGRIYTVRLRPMLPDERTCGDVART